MWSLTGDTLVLLAGVRVHPHVPRLRQVGGAGVPGDGGAAGRSVLAEEGCGDGLAALHPRVPTGNRVTALGKHDVQRLMKLDLSDWAQSLAQGSLSSSHS